MKVTLGYIPDNAIETAVAISAMSITYEQNADTNSYRNESQFLTIEAQNACGEDSWYYDLKIDTKWSINDTEDIADLVRDFKKRMELEITKEDDIKVCEHKKQE